MKEFQNYDYKLRDELYVENVQRILDERGYGLNDILKNWTAYVQRRDELRFLAHYELFKRIMEIPGNIVELGVFRGGVALYME